MKASRERSCQQKRIILKGPSLQERFQKLQKIRPLDPDNSRLVWSEEVDDHYLMEVQRIGCQNLGWLCFFGKESGGKIVTIKRWKVCLSGSGYPTFDETLMWEGIILYCLEIKKLIEAALSKPTKTKPTKRSRRS